MGGEKLGFRTPVLEVIASDRDKLGTYLAECMLLAHRQRVTLVRERIAARRSVEARARGRFAKSNFPATLTKTLAKVPDPSVQFGFDYVELGEARVDVAGLEAMAEELFNASLSWLLVRSFEAFEAAIARLTAVADMLAGVPTKLDCASLTEFEMQVTEHVRYISDERRPKLRSYEKFRSHLLGLVGAQSEGEAAAFEKGCDAEVRRIAAYRHKIVHQGGIVPEPRSFVERDLKVPGRQVREMLRSLEASGECGWLDWEVPIRLVKGRWTIWIYRSPSDEDESFAESSLGRLTMGLASSYLCLSQVVEAWAVALPGA